MTQLATSDSEVICRIQLTGEGRWVSLALSLGHFEPVNRFLVSSERLLYDVAGADEAARTYNFSNWRGGVISGVRYALRALKAPNQQVCLHELRGQLSSGDVWAISSAAAFAVGRLLDRPAEFPIDLNGWVMEEEVRRALAEEVISQSNNAVPAQPSPLQELVEDRRPDSGKAKTNGTTNLSAEPLYEL